MFDDFDPRWTDDARQTEDIYDTRWNDDAHDRDEDGRDRDHERDRDPRDVFLRELDLPRGLERELVQDERERAYQLDGEDSRTLVAVGAVRVVSAGNLRDSREEVPDSRWNDDLRHLRDEGLIRTVSLDGRDKGVVLTDRGRRRPKRRR